MSNRKDNKGRNLRIGESQRNDGQYMYRYTDLLGERQCVYSWRLTKLDKPPKGKKEDVSLREKEEEINLMLKSGISIQAKKMTLNEVFEIYVQKKKRKGKPLAPRTKENYRTFWKKNIQNTILGNKVIGDICKVDIVLIYNELLELGLSYGTVTFFHKMLNSVFNYAMDGLEIINRNPCRHALDNIEGMQKETVPLTKAQDKELMKFVRENDAVMYRVFLVMRESMVRIGECAAITKSDIDFARGTVTISKQLIYFKSDGEEKGRLHISETKGRNIRNIPLKKNVLRVLKELVDDAGDDICIDGVRGFIFTKNGKIYSPDELRLDMQKTVEWYNQKAKNKIVEFTPKTLRHTGCTMYAREGMDISVLQYILGHKSSYTTMRFYNHVTEERVLDSFNEHVNSCA